MAILYRSNPLFLWTDPQGAVQQNFFNTLQANLLSLWETGARLVGALSTDVGGTSTLLATSWDDQAAAAGANPTGVQLFGVVVGTQSTQAPVNLVTGVVGDVPTGYQVFNVNIKQAHNTGRILVVAQLP